MDLYLFLSGEDDTCVGFTTDKSGANLPADLGPWRIPEGEDLPPTSLVMTVLSCANACAKIEADGYYVAHTEDPKIIRPVFGRRST